MYLGATARRSVFGKNRRLFTKNQFVAVSFSKQCFSDKVLADSGLKSEIPVVKGIPVLGTTLSLLASGGPAKLHEYIDKRHKQFGPLFKDSIGSVKAVFVADPEWAKALFIQKEGKYPKHVYPEAWAFYNDIKKCQRGIFFMEGEEWHKYRQILNKILLGPKAFGWMKNPIDAVARSSVNRWFDCSSENSQIVNLESQLYRWSLEGVTAVLLGKRGVGDLYKLDGPLTELTTVVRDVFKTTTDLMLLPPKLARKLNLISWRRFETAMDGTLKAGRRLTVELFRYGRNGDGLLDKMLAGGVSEDVVHRIVTDLLLAAGDTTAHTMEWTLYLLGENPEIQIAIGEAMARARPVENLTSVTEYPDALRGSIQEAMRLFPVAPFLNRILTSDATICGHRVSAGTLVIVSAYTMGRDESFFAEPYKFWPGRWYRKAHDKSERVAAFPGASIPFALGARSCIGQIVALSQLHLTLAKLLNDYTVKVENKNKIEAKLRMITVPSEPIQISLHKK